MLKVKRKDFKEKLKIKGKVFNMEERNYILQILFFAGICVALGVAVWLGIHTLEDYREEYDTMKSEQENFEGIMENLRAKNRTLQSIHQVNLGDVQIVKKGKESEFYTVVRSLIDKNSITMISMRNDEPSVFNLSLRGDYYSLIHLFADWREMPFASRMTELKIRRDDLAPDRAVEADLTLEAWISE
ncbi:MAG: hypothetical protein IJ597_07960 [Synergistaceae bacterium]|nr:hypothetical protein [Synergistaceae bacterium]